MRADDHVAVLKIHPAVRRDDQLAARDDAAQIVARSAGRDRDLDDRLRFAAARPAGGSSRAAAGASAGRGRLLRRQREHKVVVLIGIDRRGGALFGVHTACVVKAGDAARRRDGGLLCPAVRGGDLRARPGLGAQRAGQVDGAHDRIFDRIAAAHVQIPAVHRQRRSAGTVGENADAPFVRVPGMDGHLAVCERCAVIKHDSIRLIGAISFSAVVGRLAAADEQLGAFHLQHTGVDAGAGDRPAQFDMHLSVPDRQRAVRGQTAHLQGIGLRGRLPQVQRAAALNGQIALRADETDADAGHRVFALQHDRGPRGQPDGHTVSVNFKIRVFQRQRFRARRPTPALRAIQYGERLTRRDELPDLPVCHRVAHAALRQVKHLPALHRREPLAVQREIRSYFGTKIPLLGQLLIPEPADKKVSRILRNAAFWRCAARDRLDLRLCAIVRLPCHAARAAQRRRILRRRQDRQQRQAQAQRQQNADPPFFHLLSSHIGSPIAVLHPQYTGTRPISQAKLHKKADAETPRPLL